MQTSQVRTTVYLDEDLYLAAKKKAIEKRTTLTDLIEKGLKNQVLHDVSTLEKKSKKKTNELDELMGAFKTKKKIPFKVARRAFEEALARGEV